MKLLVRYSVFVFCFFIAICVSGCKKESTQNLATHKVVFKANASNGCILNMAVYGYDATLTTISNIGGASWESPEITTTPNATLASISINGIGVNASSTLKVEIYVDGLLKKEASATGTALSANLRYDLK